MLPKPLAYLHVSCLMGNPGNNALPLQLPSVHHNSSVMERACDAEERKDNAKRGFGQQNITKERLGVI